MKLIVKGRPVGRGVNQDLIREATNYYTDLLMREDASRIGDLTVNIHLIPNLRKDYGGVGFCRWSDKPLRPNKFLIEIDSGLSHKTTLITLAHETTHIKQMAFGHKQDSLDGTATRWMGMLIPEDTHYYDLPWEIDAHGREYGLYDRFVNLGKEVEPSTIYDNENPLFIVRI